MANWIAGAINPAHKGALHQELGIPQGQTIPAKTLAKAAQSNDPTERRRALLAETLRRMHG